MSADKSRPSLRGKVALVTGGARGLGAEVAEQLLCAGSQVAVSDVDGDALGGFAAAHSGLPLLTVVYDSSDPDSVEAMFDHVTSRFGLVELLHNNAGNVGEIAPIWDTNIDQFDAVMRVHARGMFLVLRTAVRRLRAAGSIGAVVNTASNAALGGVPLRTAYVMAKHAVVGLTRAAAAECGPMGIRVNAVAPGPINTRFVEPMARHWGDGDTRQGLCEIAKGIPLGRLAQIDEVARAVCWLLSEEASHCHGVVLPIDGGRSAFC